MVKLHAETQEKVENMNMSFKNCHRWRFSQILTQINKIIFDLYMGPGLSPIKYGTAHDNYLKSTFLKLKKNHMNIYYGSRMKNPQIEASNYLQSELFRHPNLKHRSR